MKCKYSYNFEDGSYLGSLPLNTKGDPIVGSGYTVKKPPNLEKNEVAFFSGGKWKKETRYSGKYYDKKTGELVILDKAKAIDKRLSEDRKYANLGIENPALGTPYEKDSYRDENLSWVVHRDLNDYLEYKRLKNLEEKFKDLKNRRVN